LPPPELPPLELPLPELEPLDVVLLGGVPETSPIVPVQPMERARQITPKALILILALSPALWLTLRNDILRDRTWKGD
jgi:hypothetical protein